MSETHRYDRPIQSDREKEIEEAKAVYNEISSGILGSAFIDAEVARLREPHAAERDSELARLRKSINEEIKMSNERGREIGRLRESNARLLEALRWAHESLGPGPNAQDEEDIQRYIYAAIRAAEGEK